MNEVVNKKQNRKERRASLKRGMMGEEDLPTSVIQPSELSDLILSVRPTDNVDWKYVSTLTYSDQMSYLKECMAKNLERAKEAIDEIKSQGVNSSEHNVETPENKLSLPSEEENQLDIHQSNGYKMSEENKTSSNFETLEKKETTTMSTVEQQSTENANTTLAKVPGVWEAVKASKVTYVLVGVALTLLTAMAAAKLAGKEDELTVSDKEAV